MLKKPETDRTCDAWVWGRFLTDGTWDKLYGDGGVATIDVASQDDRSRTLKVLPDQRVLIVGQGK